MNGFEQYLQQSEQLELLPRFERYAQELERWNRAKKLTAIHGREEIFERHFLDSVLQVSLLIPRDATLIDIGCGAGFPGFPMKIVRPDIQLIAVDSISKKIAFLRHLARTLGLQGVQYHDCRAEELTHLHGVVDVVTFRAVSATAELVKIGLPFIRQTGKLLLWKTKRDIPDAAQVALRHNLHLTFHGTMAGGEMGILELTPSCTGE